MHPLLVQSSENDGIIDVIIEDLAFVHMFIHRKLLKVELGSINSGISWLHVILMRMLKEAGPLPVSEVGRRLSISRPQMTHLVNHLIALGLVERHSDTRDRRLVKLELTEKGRVTLEACRKLVRDNIKERLSSLKDDDIAELSVSLRKLKEIGSRLG